MSLRHFALLFGICLVWGFNFVVAKWSLSGTPVLVEGFEGSPPFFFAFLRFFLLYAVLAILLLESFLAMRFGRRGRDAAQGGAA